MPAPQNPSSFGYPYLEPVIVRHEEGAARAIRNQLKGVTINEIQERVERFFARPIADQTDTEIRSGFNKIVLPGESRSMAFTKSTVPIAEGTNFFRGRRVFDPRTELRTTDDFWEPRPDLIKSPGRLNSVGESILYTSLGDPVAVVHECRFDVGDKFAISRFEAKSSFHSTLVGEDPLTPGLTSDEISKLQVIQRFLARAFSTKKSSTNPDPYRLSRLIALEYFDLPPQLYKGWAFRTVADPGGLGWNFSFRPAVGRRTLRYKETHVYRLLGFESDNRRPVTELIEAIRPANGDRLLWKSPAELDAIKPFWS